MNNKINKYFRIKSKKSKKRRIYFFKKNKMYVNLKRLESTCNTFCLKLRFLFLVLNKFKSENKVELLLVVALKSGRKKIFLNNNKFRSKNLLLFF